MGMNYTSVIDGCLGCQRSKHTGRTWGTQVACRAYRHRIVSNNPAIMKAKAFA